MPSKRELDLIMNLRNSAKNKSEIKKLENSIKTINELSKVTFKTLNTKTASKDIEKLRKNLDLVARSLRDLAKGKDVNFTNLRKGVQKSLDILNKVIEAAKRGKGELGRFARDNIGEFINLTKTFNALQKEVDRLEKKLSKSASTSKKAAREFKAASQSSQKEIIKQSQTIKNLERFILEFGKTSFNVWTKSLDLEHGQVVVLEKVRGGIQKLSVVYQNFLGSVEKAEKGILSLKVAQEAANKVVKTANTLIETLGTKHSRVAQKAKEAAAAYLGLSNIMKYLKTSTKELNTSLAEVERREKTLATASNYLSNSQTLLREKVALSAQKMALLEKETLKLSKDLNLLRKNASANSKVIAVFEKRLELLGAKAKIASEDFKRMNTQLMQTEQRLGDSSRAMGRMSSQGFADMIISQAAWMAGFQLIFGVLGKFKDALTAVTENQKAVARAMRTARDETMSQKEITEKYTNAVNRMRATIGAAAEETGEALYQLGSAGLNVRESLAALDSTMDNILGTEADMEQITNLVAGVYNNFGDQIVKIDGKIRTISNTFDDYNNKIITSASLTEKFKRINDMLVRTFDAHQAEMDQIRDGLKFMAQSAKIANLSLSEQLGILATLHDHLIKAGAAGRGMRVILSRITKEAGAFKEAFDLDIDLSAPIDLIDILRQLHEKLKGNILSVDQLGQFFKRLGLRGVEPLLVLINHFDELNDNIVDIVKNSEDAAINMRKMRLGNLADQAKIASEKINVLLIHGLTPLMDVVSRLVGMFNLLGKSIGDANNVFGIFSGWIMKIAGWGAIVVGFSFAFRNLGKIVVWVREVFIHLIYQMKNFGDVALESNAKARASGQGISFLGASAEGASGRVGLLSKSFGFLKSVMGSIVFIAIIEGMARLIEYTNNFRRNLKEEINSLRNEERQLKVNASNLEELKKKYSEAIGVSNNWRKTLAEAARQLNLNLKEYSNQKEALAAINKSLDKRIELQTTLMNITREEKIRKEIKETKLTVLEAQEAYRKLTMTNWDLTKSLLAGKIEWESYGSIIQYAILGREKKLSDFLKWTTEHLSALKESLTNLNKRLLETDSSKTKNEILELIKAVLKEKDVYEELYHQLKKKLEIEQKGHGVASRTKKEIENQADALKKLAEGTKVSAETAGKWIKEWGKTLKGLEKSVSRLRREMESLEGEIRRSQKAIQDFNFENFDSGIERSDEKLDGLKRRFDAAGKSSKNASREMSSAGSSMKAYSQFATGFSGAMTIVSSTTQSVSKSQKESTKITKEQKKIGKEMIKVIKEQIGDLEGFKGKLSEIFEKRTEEIKITDKSQKTLKVNKEEYARAKEALDKFKSLLTEEFEAQKALIKIRKELGIITEAQAKEELKGLELKYQKELNTIFENRKKIVENQMKIEAALNAQKKKSLDEIKEKMDELNKKTGKLQEKMGKLKAKVNDEQAKRAIDDLIRRAKDLNKELKKPITKIVTIIERRKKEQDKYSGGVIRKALGGMVPARVTSGEGFIPPGRVQNNLSMLNTLNSGRIPSRIPSSVERFTGPGGIDNINTYLPVGSYVISKKGMEAYERSASQGTQTFQEGGEVANVEAPATLTSTTAPEPMGSFTIVVEKGGSSKEFPIMGEVSVLKSLRDELEEDRLTRLH